MRKILGYPYTNIVLLAVISRSLLLLFGYAILRISQRDDPSPDLIPNNSPFKFLLSWDAIHFLGITEKGYTHEHSLPFFPLLPYLIRQIPVGNNLTRAVIVNNVFFVLCSVMLYKITLLRHSHEIAILSTIFFIFSPSGIIYSAFYSECLFTLLFFIAYYYIETNRNLKALSLLSLCGLCRSNAILFVVFVKTLLFFPLLALLGCFQLFSLLLIWRNSCEFGLFLPYSVIQVKYWHHGLFNFYRAHNLGNMAFGAPFILFGLYIIYEHVNLRLPLEEDEQPEAEEEPEAGLAARKKIRMVDRVLSTIKETGTSSSGKFSYARFALNFLADPFFSTRTPTSFKLVLILLIQLTIIIFLAHWNMACRFISYNPILYWGFASICRKKYSSKFFRIVAGVFFASHFIFAMRFTCFYVPA